MEPWQSWAVVLLGGGAAYYYYTSQGRQNKSRPTRSSSSAPEQARPRSARREDNKPRRKGDSASRKAAENSDVPSAAEVASSDPASASDRTKKRKKAKKPAQESPLATKPEAPVADKKETEDGGDLEFAKQLTGVRQGSSLKPQVPNGKMGSRAAAKPAPNFSATSSTTGADADDDLSPALSPTLGATASGTTPSGADVSDMLEPAQAGPSVMRITESEKPQRAKQPQQQNAFQTQETKKQRQNRRKAEEKKLQRQEEEKERKTKLEKQLRTAREARGEPAKNGLATAKPPTQSPWTAGAGAPASSDATAVPSGEAPLLDTFDQDISTTDSDEAQASGTSATTTGTNWERELPSEEDQLRMINEQDESSWNTVSSKKAKKKTANPNGANGVDGANGHATGNESSDAAAPREKSAKKENKPSYEYSIASGSSEKTVTPSPPEPLVAQPHPNDSDWAVV